MYIFIIICYHLSSPLIVAITFLVYVQLGNEISAP